MHAEHTLALPKSSHSRRIVATEDISFDVSFKWIALPHVPPSPKRKNKWTITTYTPELTLPFSKYFVAFGRFPEANHLASSRNALHKLAH